MKTIVLFILMIICPMTSFAAMDYDKAAVEIKQLFSKISKQNREDSIHWLEFKPYYIACKSKPDGYYGLVSRYYPHVCKAYNKEGKLTNFPNNSSIFRNDLSIQENAKHFLGNTDIGSSGQWEFRPGGDTPQSLCLVNRQAEPETLCIVATDFEQTYGITLGTFAKPALLVTVPTIIALVLCRFTCN